MELTPKTRKETFLAAAGGQDVTTPTPITREEVFLDAIAKSGGGGGSSGGGGLKVDVTVTRSGGVTTYTLHKTWRQISDAIDNGIIPYTIVDDGGQKKVDIVSLIYSYEDSGDMYYIVDFGERCTYEAYSENEYPTYSYAG